MANNLESNLKGEPTKIKVGRYGNEISRRGSSSYPCSNSYDNNRAQGTIRPGPFKAMKRGALAIMLGASLMGLTGVTYAQEKDNPNNLIEKSEAKQLWENRIDDDIYKENVAFTAYVGEGKNKQTELFVGKIDNDGNARDIKRITYTPEFEIGPIFTDTLRIDYGRGISVYTKDLSHAKWFRMNKDGTNIQPIDFTTWRMEYGRDHR
ncbi:MAG: hypothetical protein V1660_03880 [archaeon]